jgi:hypothetical protein
MGNHLSLDTPNVDLLVVSEVDHVNHRVLCVIYTAFDDLVDQTIANTKPGQIHLQNLANYNTMGRLYVPQYQKSDRNHEDNL